MRGEEPLIETKSSGDLGAERGMSRNYCFNMAQRLAVVHAATNRLIAKCRSRKAGGASLSSLHILLESHHHNMIHAADRIFERIGVLASQVRSDVDSAAREADFALPDVVAELVREHELVMEFLLSAADAAGDFGDLVTEDLLSQRIVFHEGAIKNLLLFRT